MKKILITGGAGFIGINAAIYFQKKNYQIFILDNLSRKGTKFNIYKLNKLKNINFIKADIRNKKKIFEIIRKIKPNLLLHLAAQVAVTTSVLNPYDDYEINIKGTLNLLEALRLHSNKTHFINASTNKVYGKINEDNLIQKKERYVYGKKDKPTSEKQNLDFYSPYGCSKGSADQYVNDYARIYNLKTTNFRQSCIYGKYQFGVEDQGWIAWFTIAILLNKKITIYGNGKQVRDALNVLDLCDAYYLSYRKKIYGTFNIGGGLLNSISLIELLKLIKNITKKKIRKKITTWRPGDQKIFISDNKKFENLSNWKPKITFKKGLSELIEWTKENINDIEKILK